MHKMGEKLAVLVQRIVPCFDEVYAGIVAVLADLYQELVVVREHLGCLLDSQVKRATDGIKEKLEGALGLCGLFV